MSESPRADALRSAEAQPYRQPASSPESRLISRCRSGEEEAWALLVGRFSRYVHAIAVHAFRLEEHEAEDVFQEVFARTYENLDRLRDDAAIRPWLGQLTRRLAIDRLRANARTFPTDETLERDLQPGPGPDIDEAITVRAALAGLPENCREILYRFFVRDESYETIGKALGLPMGTIASRISRCLDKMGRELGGREHGSRAS